MLVSLMTGYLLAQASLGEQLFSLLFIVVVVVIALISWVIQGPAIYDLNDKGGAPYCPRCNRQVSLRRQYCRSCGYTFVSYQPRTPSPPKPFIDPETKKGFEELLVFSIRACEICVFGFVWLVLSLRDLVIAFICFRWLKRMPEWAQPIVCGILIPLPFVAVFILVKFVSR